MSEYVSAELRRLVCERASGLCEYCLLREEDAFLPHEPDHIIAVKHRGLTIESNIAWTCFVCNRAKGSDISSIDEATGELQRLFNPRVDVWEDNFRLLVDGKVLPLTSIGRVTAFLLRLNRPELVEIRKVLAREGRKPR